MMRSLEGGRPGREGGREGGRVMHYITLVAPLKLKVGQCVLLSLDRSLATDE